MNKTLLFLALAAFGAQSFASESSFKFRSYFPGLKSEAGRLTPNPSVSTPPAKELPPPGVVFLPAAMDTGLSQPGNLAVKTYQLGFTGPASVKLTSLSVTAGAGVFSISSNSCLGQTFEPGQTCSFDLTVNTSTPGTFNGQLIAQGLSEGQVVNDESPVYAYVPSGLSSTFTEFLGWNRDFGQVGLNTTPSSRTIQYMRTGGSELLVYKVTSANTDFNIDSVNCTVNGAQNSQLPVSITRLFSTGDQCFIRVSINTSTSGFKNGSILIDSNDQNSSSKVIPLIGEVVAPRSSISNLDGTSFNSNFGSVVVNAEPVRKTVKVAPDTAAPLVVDSIAVSGDFSASAQTCSVGGVTKSLPATLINSSDFCQATISHTPVTEGQKTGSLTILTNEASQPAPINLSLNVVAQPSGPDYSQAFGAFALRKVNPSYTGPAIQVNGVDVFFDQNGQLNPQQLTQVQNGNVSIWYNQSGGAPLTLSIGNGPQLVVENGKPTLVFTQDNLGLGTLPVGTDPKLELFMASKGNSTVENTAAASLSNRGTNTSAYHVVYTHENHLGAGVRAFIRGNTSLNENGVTRSGRNVFSYTHNKGTVSLAVDGTAIQSVSGVTTTLGGAFFDVGGAPAFNQYHNGSISEVILFVGSNNTDVQTVSSEIKAANPM